MTGGYNFTDDAPPQPFIPIVAYWDDDNKVPWALPHVYDYMEGQDAVAYTYPQMGESYNGRKYLTAYSKQQHTEFGDIILDHDGTPDSYSGYVSVNDGVLSLGEEGEATYTFSISSAGTYDIAVRLCYTFWDKNGVYISIDGNTTHFKETRLWWPYWRTTFWKSLYSGYLSAGTHTITISVDAENVLFYGFRVCTGFAEYSDKEKHCETPHVTEDEIKAAFVSTYNQLLTEKKEIIANAEIIRKTLCRTDALEQEKHTLEDEMNVVAEMTQSIIAENARVAQDQDEYQERYNGLVERYDTAKARYDEVLAAISAKEAQNERLANFIKVLKAQDGTISEFDEQLWGSMVEFVTVGRKKEITVTFRDGTEIEA